MKNRSSNVKHEAQSNRRKRQPCSPASDLAAKRSAKAAFRIGVAPTLQRIMVRSDRTLTGIGSINSLQEEILGVIEGIWLSEVQNS